MNLVLNGGVTPNQQRKSPLLSHGMLQAQQQQPQHTVTTEKPLLSNQYLSANIAASKPLLASPPPYQLPNQLSMNANAALFAQQQAQAHLIAQQNLLAHHQQQQASAAAAASVSHMPGFTLIPQSAANQMHSTTSLAVAQSQLMQPQQSGTMFSQHHVQNLASLTQQHSALPPNLMSNLMTRTAGYPTASAMPASPSALTQTHGLSQTLPYALSHSGLPFATFNPYTNSINPMLLSPHSFSSLQLKTTQTQTPQARTFATPTYTHTLQHHHPHPHHPHHHAQQHHHHHHHQQQPQATASLQQITQIPTQMTNFQQQLSMNANAAAATSLMHSIKRSYESAFHQDPSSTLHHQKRPTQFTGTGIL